MTSPRLGTSKTSQAINLEEKPDIKSVPNRTGCKTSPSDESDKSDGRPWPWAPLAGNVRKVNHLPDFYADKGFSWNICQRQFSAINFYISSQLQIFISNRNIPIFWIFPKGKHTLHMSCIVLSYATIWFRRFTGESRRLWRKTKTWSRWKGKTKRWWFITYNNDLYYHDNDLYHYDIDDFRIYTKFARKNMR